MYPPAPTDSKTAVATSDPVEDGPGSGCLPSKAAKAAHTGMTGILLRDGCTIKDLFSDCLVLPQGYMVGGKDEAEHSGAQNLSTIGVSSTDQANPSIA